MHDKQPIDFNGKRKGKQAGRSVSLFFFLKLPLGEKLLLWREAVNNLVLNSINKKKMRSTYYTACL